MANLTSELSWLLHSKTSLTMDRLAKLLQHVLGLLNAIDLYSSIGVLVLVSRQNLAGDRFPLIPREAMSAGFEHISIALGMSPPGFPEPYSPQ